ncbi:PREDICTED: lipoxygenase homology domain-containing protein 1-like [Priapulus caudatus]|uniref:Lipoxygenase homology domain-containing protein 1-like n=1 Tax=Priapulus caudatus TaxID=37621 RepID=A0ABM1DUQ6_PRICU|nr:PREDICTED: lipoxygenase homology domain-containing protein 1-like [Priapulus caudatus]
MSDAHVCALLSVMNYWLCVHTGSQQETPVDPNVYITLHGTRGDTGLRLLCRIGHHVIFQRNQVDIFAIEAVDLGDIDSIQIRKNPGGPWHLKQIILKEEQFAPVESYFYLDDWLGGHDGEDRWAEVVDFKFPRTAVRQSEVSVPPTEDCMFFTTKGTWSVSAVTGAGHVDGGNLATATLLVQFVGENSASALVKVAPRVDDSAPGNITFELDMSENVGELLKVRIGFDDPTNDPAWLLESTDMFEVEAVELGVLTKILLEYETETGAGWFLSNVRVHDASEPGTHYEFVSERWLSKDGAPQREIELTSIKHYAASNPETGQRDRNESMVKYVVEVHTSLGSAPHMSARVYMTIYGEDGESEKNMLTSGTDEGTQMFKPGKGERFVVDSPGLGKLQRIVIGHNGSGPNPCWYLDKVLIREQGSETDIVFPCDKWLDESKKGCVTEVELVPEAS